MHRCKARIFLWYTSSWMENFRFSSPEDGTSSSAALRLRQTDVTSLLPSKPSIATPGCWRISEFKSTLSVTNPVNCCNQIALFNPEENIFPDDRKVKFRFCNI